MARSIASLIFLIFVNQWKCWIRTNNSVRQTGFLPWLDRFFALFWNYKFVFSWLIQYISRRLEGSPARFGPNKPGNSPGIHCRAPQTRIEPSFERGIKRGEDQYLTLWTDSNFRWYWTMNFGIRSFVVFCGSCSSGFAEMDIIWMCTPLQKTIIFDRKMADTTS